LTFLVVCFVGSVLSARIPSQRNKLDFQPYSDSEDAKLTVVCTCYYYQTMK
jgi:hypothetical protein